MSLLESLAGAVSGSPAGAQGGEGAIIGAVLKMVQSHPGGVGGLVQAFESAGLGGVAQSWIGQGANQPVSPAQVQQALGPERIGEVAAQLGVPQPTAAGHIAQYLPQIIDHLTPQGAPPADGGQAAIGGLLSRFGL